MISFYLWILTFCHITNCCLAVVLLMTFPVRKLLHLYNISPFIGPRLISTQSLSIRLARFVICPNLQFQAEEHSEEDKTETEEADGQADQPSEQSSLPGRIVELLTARYGTAALHSLQRQQRTREQPGSLFVFCHDCNQLQNISDMSVQNVLRNNCLLGRVLFLLTTWGEI